MGTSNAGPTLTSTQAADLLQVHPSTVKRWCNDGELAYETTSGGHRRIPLDAVTAFARQREIDTVLDPFHPYQSHVWGAYQQVESTGALDRALDLAMGWVHRGHLRRVVHLMQGLAETPGVDLCRFCDEGVRGLMQRVGDEWRQGRLRVGEEHMVSQAMTEVLIRLRPVAPAPPPNAPRPRAVVGSMEGNQHHLGSLTIRLLLEGLGWEVFYLGPDVPLEDFAAIQRGRAAELVCVSLPAPGAPGDAARTVRVLGEFYDFGQPYSLALGGYVPDDVDGEQLGGPFREVGIFSDCRSFRERLTAGWARPALAETGA